MTLGATCTQFVRVGGLCNTICIESSCLQGCLGALLGFNAHLCWTFAMLLKCPTHVRDHHDTQNRITKVGKLSIEESKAAGSAEGAAGKAVGQNQFISAVLTGRDLQTHTPTNAGNHDSCRPWQPCASRSGLGRCVFAPHALKAITLLLLC